MRLSVVTAPTAEPIHLDEAKAHLRVEIAADDAEIPRYVADGREYLEQTLGRQLVVGTFKLTLDGFPEEDDRIIRFPRVPLVSVSSITYLDTDEAQQTLATDQYVVDTSDELGRIYEAYGETWPSTLDQWSAVEITFVAGHACPFTAVAATNVITANGRTLTNGQKFRLQNSGGALPAGLSALTDHYVVEAAGSTAKLSLTSGGAAVDITDAGTGTHFLGEVPARAKDWLKLYAEDRYRQRGGVLSGTIVGPVPWALETLLQNLWTGQH